MSRLVTWSVDTKLAWDVEADVESKLQAENHLRSSGARYCRTHNVRVCLYIAYIACACSASLYIKTLYFLFCTLALSAAATVANIKIRYDVKTPQFAILRTRIIYVFYITWNGRFVSPGWLDLQCSLWEGRPVAANQRRWRMEFNLLLPPKLAPSLEW